MSAIPYGQFNHANLVYARVVSSVAPGTDYILQTEAAVNAAVATGEVVNIKLPVLKTSPYGPSIYFLRWTGNGTLNFSVVVGSTDVVTSVAPGNSFLEADYGSPTEFIVLALANAYRIITLREGSASGAVSAVAPNIQVVTNTVDAGHSTAGALHFAAAAGTAAPTLATNAICLGNASGRSHGFRSVTMGTITSNVADDSIAIGELGAGLVAANSQLVGQAVGVGAQSRVMGLFTNVGIGCSVVGEGQDVGDEACVLGNATGNVPAGAILLGTGAASATPNRLNVLNVESEIANTQANGDDYEFLALNLNGNLRYIPLTHTTALNGQNDGLNLICMGENACGGPSGSARTILGANVFPSIAIGEGACSNWNATASASNYGIAIGTDAQKNCGAGLSRVRYIAIGDGANAGTTATQSGTGDVVIGHQAQAAYQTATSNVVIGDLACQFKPASSFDLNSVKVGASIQQAATGTGGSNQTLLGARIMQNATCTFAESSGAIMIGFNCGADISGQVGYRCLMIGQITGRYLPFVPGASDDNMLIGGNTLSGTGTAIGKENTVIGGAVLNQNNAGLADNATILGARSFAAVAAPLSSRITCLGSRQTGAPNANEVMLGYACAAAGVTGRLSFGNAMEAVAAAATAGAAALPAAPAAFIPISWNGVNYKIPVYNP